MTDALYDIFPGPTKRKILWHLAAAAPEPVSAADLCTQVFSDSSKKNRDTLRNLIAHMRPKLVTNGYRINGRNELRANAYQLVDALMER